MQQRRARASLSRRAFLHAVGAGLGSAGLSGLLNACGAPAPSATPAAVAPPTTAPAPTTAPPTAAPATIAAPAAEMTVVDFRGAQSVAVAAPGDRMIYVALGSGMDLRVARSADGGHSFGEPALVNQGAPALVMAVERPALAAGADGVVGLAWVEHGEEVFNIRYARSEDGARSFAAGALAHRGGHDETTMASLALDHSNHPLIAWLEGGRLRVARSLDHGDTFPIDQVVDDQVCDCCQPHPLVWGDRTFVAFRNLEREAQSDDIRDIYLVASADNGKTFGPPVRASDAHWYLNACPISGPALAAGGERLYVCWMDGRNDTSRAALQSDVWLAISQDGGQSFGPNVRVSPAGGGYANLPVLALDPDGGLHICWEASEPQGQVLNYTRSDDGGTTFATPRVIAGGAGSARQGRPNSATLIVSRAGQAHMTWVDAVGAHIATWNI